MDSRSLAYSRLSDGGPLYAETQLAHVVKEPFNAVTATFFLIIALYGLWRLRGRYRQFRFLTFAMGMLLVGGVGGTLFHAFRSSPVYLFLDVMPIGVICLALSIWLWFRILPNRWLVVPVLVPFFVAQRAVRWVLPGTYAISASYAVLALIVVVPMLLVLRKEQWRDGKFVFATIALFAVALTFRTIDPLSPEWISVGTHWLWHSFSAVAVAALARWVYGIEATGSDSSRLQRSP